MTKIVLDAATLAKLGGLTQSVGLYDERGNFVGYCTPLETHLRSVDLAGPDPFSGADAAVAVSDGPAGITTAELLRRLREL